MMTRGFPHPAIGASMSCGEGKLDICYPIHPIHLNLCDTLSTSLAERHGFVILFSFQHLLLQVLRLCGKGQGNFDVAGMSRLCIIEFLVKSWRGPVANISKRMQTLYYMYYANHFEIHSALMCFRRWWFFTITTNLVQSASSGSMDQ